MMRHIFLRALAVVVLLLTGMAAAETPNRVTILYDSFGKNPSLTMDWGFAALAQVRHGTVGKSPNPFGISSSDRRVCTTFWIQTLRQAQTELTEQGFLFRGGFGHTPQVDLSPIRCG